MKSPRIILGIETSCDDTSACLMDYTTGHPKVLAHHSFSQDFLLNKWGGVVPELAARSHVKAIPPLLEVCFRDAGLSPDSVTELAVTTHPGLLGSLLTGINLAKSFALIRALPIVPVNHLFAHLEAIHLTELVAYPYLGLLVSGGHTAVFLVEGPDKMKALGNTLDDAAGEAFDKGGKMLGLGYPAGRIIDERSRSGDREKYKFPISYMRDRPGKMSFSGLKTALRVRLQKMDPGEISNELPHLCAGYQEAIVQTLRLKTEEVVEKIIGTRVRVFNLPIVVGGGVACNSRLREVMKSAFSDVHFVSPEFSTDNAAMVANWAGRVPHLKVPFPQCLSLDATSRFLEKN